MAARPVLIAQISDLHITPPGTFAYGCVDTAAALTAAIDTLNRFSPRPDLVVISGDIAHAALPEEYQHARNCCARYRYRSRQSLEITIAGQPFARPFPIPLMARPTAHLIQCVAPASSIFC